jgi:hypothetical protein
MTLRHATMTPRVMTISRVAAALALCSFLMPGRAYSQGWRFDRRVATDLQQSGVHQETSRADLYFDADALTPAQITTFTALVDQGIQNIEKLLDTSLPADRKVRYFISRQFEISHSQGHSVYLPLDRVAHQTAPYLHETTHIIAPCAECPMWFSEGLASYVQSHVAETMGGYDGIIFARRGNRGIDRDSLRWLADKRGQTVLPFIGTVDEPPEIGEDRENVAAPFYVMAQSLVKFIVESSDMKKLCAVMSAPDFEASLKQLTGKSSQEWKQTWLTKIRS